VTIAVAVLAASSAGPATAAPRTVHDLLHVTVKQPRSARLAAPGGVSAVTLRVRAPACARRAPLVLTVRVNGRLIGRRSLRGPRWRSVSLPHALAPGHHRVLLSVRGRRSCPKVTVDELALTPAVATEATPLGPRRAIPLAAAVSSGIALRLDRKLDQTFLGRFDGLTPENAMKMTYVMPERTRFDFDEPDLLVEYAARYDKPVRGHTLIWHDQVPGWLSGHRWSPDALTTVMQEWIGTSVGRYAGRLVDWDVVNEPFDSGGNWRNSVWFTTLGSGYVEQALRLAKAADPGARLFINEYDVEYPGPKQDALYALARDLKDRGAPLDGIGIQMHWTHSDLVPEATLLATFRRFAALGLRVQITEMDVTARDGSDGLVKQTEAFAMAARVCQSVSTCDRMTVWGVSDRDSWRGEGNRPLLFDSEFNEKPGYAAVRAALGAG